MKRNTRQKKCQTKKLDKNGLSDKKDYEAKNKTQKL